MPEDLTNTKPIQLFSTPPSLVFKMHAAGHHRMERWASVTDRAQLEEAIVTVTLPEEGALERLTVKVAVFKFSSVSPEIRET